MKAVEGVFTVNEEDDSLCFGAVLRFGDVRLQAANCFNTTFWRALLDFAGEAA